jgi:hypothetical protein
VGPHELGLTDPSRSIGLVPALMPRNPAARGKRAGTDFTVYIAVSAFVLNLVVAVVLTLVLRALKVPQGEDKTRRSDCGADETDPKVVEIERTQRFVEPGGPAPV